MNVKCKLEAMFDIVQANVDFMYIIYRYLPTLKKSETSFLQLHLQD